MSTMMANPFSMATSTYGEDGNSVEAVLPIHLSALEGLPGTTQINGFQFHEASGQPEVIDTFGGRISNRTGRGLLVEREQTIPVYPTAGPLPASVSAPVSADVPVLTRHMGTASFLPASFRGHPLQEDRASGRGPIELESAAALDNLMSIPGENAVVYFYKPGCRYCETFNKPYHTLASDVHRTNLRSTAGDYEGVPPTPIVMARINGLANREAINALRADFLGPRFRRNFPTILFKRGADHVGMTWDADVPRTVENISRFMADFFGDPTLAPYASAQLDERMRSERPEFIYMGDDSASVIPRFVRPLDPAYVSPEDAVATLNYLFAVDDDLASRGVFYPVNGADRPDIPVPSIVAVDPQTGESATYAYRDAHRWAIERLAHDNGLESAVPLPDAHAMRSSQAAPAEDAAPDQPATLASMRRRRRSAVP